MKTTLSLLLAGTAWAALSIVAPAQAGAREAGIQLAQLNTNPNDPNANKKKPAPKGPPPAVKKVTPPPPAAKKVVPPTPPTAQKPVVPSHPPVGQLNTTTPPKPPVVQKKVVPPPPPPAAQKKVVPPTGPAQLNTGVPKRAQTPTFQKKTVTPPTAQKKVTPPIGQLNTTTPRSPATKTQPFTSPQTTQKKPGGPAPTVQQLNPMATPPNHVRSSREFIRRDAKPSVPQIDAIRRARKEIRQGDRLIIQEPGRTIVRRGDRTIIEHNETERFAVDARNVKVEHRGDQVFSIIERPNGVRIITVTDRNGRLLRRIRQNPDGRQFVLIDNTFAPRPRDDFFVNLPPPVVRIPRDRYIVEAWHASPEQVYGVLSAPPVQRLDRHYTLEEVRYSAPLRERMPRVDLDVTFDTGSWQLTPDQVQRLSVIAEGINRAIQRNPREMFLVEGYTDAVGSDVDNLSLSDRRAEAVAVALTEQFNVPAENLVTQGYGEQYLKVQTEAAERANRRVAVRRITPLIAQQLTQAPPQAQPQDQPPPGADQPPPDADQPPPGEDQPPPDGDQPPPDDGPPPR